MDDEHIGREPSPRDQHQAADETEAASESGQIREGEQGALGFVAIVVGCSTMGAFVWWVWKVGSASTADAFSLRPSGGELGHVAFVLFVAFLVGLWWMRPDQSAVVRPVGLALLGLFAVVWGTGIFLPRSSTYVDEGGAQVEREDFVTGVYQQVIDFDTSGVLVGTGISLLSLALIAAVVRARGLSPSTTRRLALIEVLVVTATVAVLVIAVRIADTPGWTMQVNEGRRARRRVARRRGRASSHDDVAAAIWRRAHADEAESVFAFEDLRRQLEALGAPASLLLRCDRAATDERRHARLTRRLAEECGGSALPPDGPDPRQKRGLPLRSGLGRKIEIGRLAFESYTDGVVGEGFAASRLERASQDCPDARRASILKSIARDERRHQAMCADVVRWCHQQEPVPVGVAVKVAGALLPRRSRPTGDRSRLSTVAAREAGLVDGATWSALWADARQEAMHFSSTLQQAPV